MKVELLSVVKGQVLVYFIFFFYRMGRHMVDTFDFYISKETTYHLFIAIVTKQEW
jgi:multidrug resistance efflux pump